MSSESTPPRKLSSELIAIISVGALVLIANAGAVAWLDSKIERNVNRLESKIERTSNRLESKIERTSNRLEVRIKQVEDELGGVRERLAIVETHVSYRPTDEPADEYASEESGIDQPSPEVSGPINTQFEEQAGL